MENIHLTQAEQEIYNDKRVPKRWHAFLAPALMNILGGTIADIVVFIVEFLIAFRIIGFSSEFGVDMFNGLLSQMCIILPIPLILMFLFKNDIKETLRLKNDINILQILLIVFMCISAYMPAQIVNSYVVQYASLFFGPPQELSGAVSAQNIVQLLFEILMVAFLPAICEEVFYRGYVLKGLERKGKVYALIISSLLFAIMHANFQQMLYAFLLGLMLGFVVQKTNSLFASITMHATFNIMAVLLSYGPVQAIFNQYSSIIFFISLKFAPVLIIASILLFNWYTNKRNARLNISLALPKLENIKEEPYEKFLGIFFFIIFLLFNVLGAINRW